MFTGCVHSLMLAPTIFLMCILPYALSYTPNIEVDENPNLIELPQEHIISLLTPQQILLAVSVLTIALVTCLIIKYEPLPHTLPPLNYESQPVVCSDAILRYELGLPGPLSEMQWITLQNYLNDKAEHLSSPVGNIFLDIF
jgi:hypothetical protein